MAIIPIGTLIKNKGNWKLRKGKEVGRVYRVGYKGMQDLAMRIFRRFIGWKLFGLV